MTFFKQKDENNVKVFLVPQKEHTSPERRHSTQKNVQNNPSTPYINLFSITPFQHLWSNIVCTSNNVTVYFSWKISYAMFSDKRKSRR